MQSNVVACVHLHHDHTAIAMISPSAPTPFSSPRLLADIGGTNARFALEYAPHQFSAITVLNGDAYPSLHEAVLAYLNCDEVKRQLHGPILHAAFAMANPINGDFVKMTNRDWSFSIKALQHDLALETLVVVNDFTALAMALPNLSTSQKQQVGGGQTVEHHAIGLLGAGTGLGVSGIIPSAHGWVPLQSEGGHVSFSPMDEREQEIQRFLWREHPHVSAERVLSGMGLELIYLALANSNGDTPDKLSAAEISRRALSNECPLCLETIQLFCSMLGTAAGNLALTLGATGGIYIGGGIVPRLGQFFHQSLFRSRFESKGRFSAYLSAIPTFIITEPYPAFLGISDLLTQSLK